MQRVQHKCRQDCVQRFRDLEYELIGAYLTLDPEYEAAQIEVFGQMVFKGYIYRGRKTVCTGVLFQKIITKQKRTYVTWGLRVRKFMHVDCVLYRTKYKSLTHCPIPKCREPRFKGKDNNVPRKVLHYFPLIPRLQRLFIDPQVACDMRWHKEKRINDDNILRHPADTEPSSLTRGTIPLELVDASTVRSSQKRHGINEYSSGD
ncbi:hypothetical protein Tco_0883742 [Tanacetum coccineum]